MTGQVARNIENLRVLASDGLTYSEAATRLDICTPYVKALAKTHGITLVPDPTLSAERIEQIRNLAAEGLTRPQAAEQLKLHYGTVVKYAISNGIQFKHASLKTLPTVRTRQMAALYQSGKTLQEIGIQYGLSRERVRQLITKFHGLRAPDGGKHKTGADKHAIFEAKRNARSLKRWGCNFDQYTAIRNLKRPTRAFASQRQNAKKRGIGFDLTLWQWWSIWQQSGKWSQRGRGNKFMMCRTNDLGSYAIGNVYIATGCDNSARDHAKTSGLPRGVSVKRGRFYANRCISGKKIYLGIYPTPELAHAAYLSAGAAQ